MLAACASQSATFGRAALACIGSADESTNTVTSSDQEELKRDTGVEASDEKAVTREEGGERAGGG